jgi:hypothetical protein
MAQGLPLIMVMRQPARALIMVEIAGESHVVDVGVPALFPGDHVMRRHQSGG